MTKPEEEICLKSAAHTLQLRRGVEVFNCNWAVGKSRGQSKYTHSNLKTNTNENINSNTNAKSTTNTDMNTKCGTG